MQEPPRSSTPAFFRSALRDLASPVPDYASTLALQPEDDVNVVNTSYLRTPITPQAEANADSLDREVREERRRRQQQYIEARQRERDRNLTDAAQERQFQAHRAELIRQRHQSQELWAEAMSTQPNPTYGSHIPDQQSLYDWAPASLESDEEELRQLMAQMREEQPETHPEVVRAIATERQSARQHRQHYAQRASSSQQEPSLRSAAILQSVSRNWRFSTRSRALMSRYILDREQRALDSERNEQAEHTAANGPAPTQRTPISDDTHVSQSQRLPLPSSTDSPQSERIPIPDSLRRVQNHSPWPPSAGSPTSVPPMGSFGQDPATVESLRRRYLENPSTKVTEFERIIKYLHSLRSSEEDMEDDLRRHVDRQSKPDLLRGLQMDRDVTKRMHNVRPHRSSWLIPGMTFTGQQQAAPMNTVSLARASAPRPVNRDRQSNIHPVPEIRVPALGPSEPWLGRAMTSTPQPLPVSPSPQITTTSPSPSVTTDSWTVKVALHTVDYESMTILGTMEAFNVPSYNSSTMPAPGNSKTTFSTYVEGEIIDFTNHTLLTEPDRAFASKTSPDVDAAYWRKLEPFAQLSDEEIASALLDKQWIEEQLMGKYILMRWKERCFVRPTYTSFSNPRHSPIQGTSTLPRTEDPDAAASSDGPRVPRPRTPSFISHAGDGNGFGLSISGFYYVSLRRSDGHCEGLYFDPLSSPYQRLELKPVLEGAYGCGAWEMR